MAQPARLREDWGESVIAQGDLSDWQHGCCRVTFFRERLYVIALRPARAKRKNEAICEKSALLSRSGTDADAPRRGGGGADSAARRVAAATVAIASTAAAAAAAATTAAHRHPAAVRSGHKGSDIGPQRREGGGGGCRVEGHVQDGGRAVRGGGGHAGTDAFAVRAGHVGVPVRVDEAGYDDQVTILGAGGGQGRQRWGEDDADSGKQRHRGGHRNNLNQRGRPV